MEEGVPFFLDAVDDAAKDGVRTKCSHGHAFSSFFSIENEEGGLGLRRFVELDLPISPIQVHDDEVFAFTDVGDCVVTS